MVRNLYLAIKRRLQAEVGELNEVDWYLGQDTREGGQLASPAAYVRMGSFATSGLGNRQQEATIPFDIIVRSVSAYDDDRRVELAPHHLAVVEKVYVALLGFSARLSYLPEFSALVGTNNDHLIMAGISRTAYQPDHAMTGVLTTIQSFECQCKDYTAMPSYQKVVKGLEVASI